MARKTRHAPALQPPAVDPDVMEFATLAEALRDVHDVSQRQRQPQVPFPPGGRELTHDEARAFLASFTGWPMSTRKRRRGPQPKSYRSRLAGVYHKLVRLPDVRVKKRGGEALRARIRDQVQSLERDNVPRHKWRATIAATRNIGVEADRIGRLLSEMYPRK